jgi:hypothetical protein
MSTRPLPGGRKQAYVAPEPCHPNVRKTCEKLPVDFAHGSGSFTVPLMVFLDENVFA